MNLFSPTAPPRPPASTPRTPTSQTKAVQEAAAEAARRRKTARGFRSTILSRDFLNDQSPALKQSLGS